MADDWIKVRVDLSDDPNVYILSDILGLEVPTVVGHLTIFWGWMDRHTADGKGIKLSESVIDRKIGVSGFANAMRKVEWLEGENMALTVPKFERHNGMSAKARALESEAKRLRRNGKSGKFSNQPRASEAAENPTKGNVGQVSDKKSPKCPTREEERREEKSKTPAAARACAGAREEPTGHTKPPVVPERKFAMHLGWQPSHNFNDRCKSCGFEIAQVDHGFFNAALGEFCSYWQTQPGRMESLGGWDHKFLKDLQRKLAQKNQTPEQSASETRNRSLTDDLTDRSWAGGAP